MILLILNTLDIIFWQCLPVFFFFFLFFPTIHIDLLCTSSTRPATYIHISYSLFSRVVIHPCLSVLPNTTISSPSILPCSLLHHHHHFFSVFFLPPSSSLAQPLSHNHFSGYFLCGCRMSKEEWRAGVSYGRSGGPRWAWWAVGAMFGGW